MIRVLLASFASRKFVMTVFGLSCLWVVYWRQVNYLYSFAGMSPEIVAAFVSITRDFMVAFTAAILAYLGVNGVVSWRHSTESVLSQTIESIKSEHTERIIDESAGNANHKEFRDE